ncbi:DUF6233 domain-containing protein [Streptomyces glaucescens]|uniref:DUF6233 domain-containing protein n=1 Tax=Streptomyces glaucescens TaxID=1907 RepID=UPI003999E2C2
MGRSPVRTVSRTAGRGVAAAEAARRLAPAPPEWRLQSIRTMAGPKALRVQAGDCSMGGAKPVGREETRRLLTEGVEPWPYRSPDKALGRPVERERRSVGAVVRKRPPPAMPYACRYSPVRCTGIRRCRSSE